MEYSINPQVEQDSIVAYLKAQYPDMAIIEDGLPSDDDKTITYEAATGEVNTFLILWFSNPKRGKKAGFGGQKLDSYFATVDVGVIARSGTRARTVLNNVTDRLIDFKAAEGGRLSQGTALFSDARQIKQEANRPERWMRTSRFDFGIASKKTP